MTPVARGPDRDRMARAVHLDAERLEGGAWRVTGGANVHVVSASVDSCDCPDYAIRGGACKHILAARLRVGDPDTVRALRAIVPLPFSRTRSSARACGHPHLST